MPQPAAYEAAIDTFLAERQTALPAALAELERDTLAEAAALLAGTLRSGCKVLVAGNGGSAAEAQHFAAELVGRFQRERAPLPAVALTADTALLTALANDYSFAEVFARQVQALGQPGDLFLAYSTSGESENLIRAAQAAHGRQMHVLALTGGRPSRLAAEADLTVRVPSWDIPVVQELHLVVTHLLCGLVEEELAANSDNDV